MKKALPWIVMVVVGYVLLIVGVLYLVPKPWNLAVSLVALLMGVRFLFAVWKAAQLGKRSTHT